MNKIDIKNLTKKYDTNIAALDNINITFENEKIYGLLGRNGAGKTTILSAISNRIFPDAGNIYIDDANILDNPTLIKQIYCTTKKNLFPKFMKINDLIKWTSEFYVDFDKERAIELANVFNLDLGRRIKELSTGYLTITKNILALSANTSILLLDEPILGLDANNRNLFYKELLKSYAQKPRTIVISTHLIDEIDAVIENVIILNDGKVLINDETNNIIQKGYMVSGPKNIVDQFIKDKNVLGYDILGGLKAAYIFDEKRQIKCIKHESIEISKLPLDKLFIHLTDGSKNIEKKQLGI